MLGDVDAIKAERKKAKKNRNKYTGVGSEGGMSFASSTGNSGGGRYEGFGSESNYSSGEAGSSGNNSTYRNGGTGGFGSNDFFDDDKPGRYDDFDSPSSQRRDSNKSESISPAPRRVSDAKPKAKTAKELNLFDFDEPATSSNNKGKSNDDDWGDFADGDANGT